MVQADGEMEGWSILYAQRISPKGQNLLWKVKTIIISHLQLSILKIYKFSLWNDNELMSIWRKIDGEIWGKLSTSHWWKIDDQNLGYRYAIDQLSIFSASNFGRSAIDFQSSIFLPGGFFVADYPPEDVAYHYSRRSILFLTPFAKNEGSLCSDKFFKTPVIFQPKPILHEIRARKLWIMPTCNFAWGIFKRLGKNVPDMPEPRV